MKLIVCIFEQLFGLKINFHTSEILCLEGLRIKRNSISKSSVANLVLLPLNTWLSQSITENTECNLVDNRFEQKLGCWQSKLPLVGN
jgi:hypothetical protein